MIQIRRIDRKIEKDIIIAMITNRDYLAKVRPILKFEYFKNKYTRTVAKWVVDFYDQYQEPPFNEIQKIYDYQERKGQIDEDDIDLTKDLLEQAAEEYAECPNLNHLFLLEKTSEYFNRVNLERIFDEAREKMDMGLVEDATNLVFNSKPIKMNSCMGSDGLTDEIKLQEAFETMTEPLFKVPGDLGKMINQTFCRDHFIALQAGEKVGKTWFLIYLAKYALKARLKVALFELGDMTEAQTNRRMSISIARKSDQNKYCGEFRCPKRFVPNDGSLQLEGEELKSMPKNMMIETANIDLGSGLTWQEALEANQEFFKINRLKKDKHWRLITVPARTMNVRQIDAELDRLEKEEDFNADVVLVDYMELLAPENTKEEGRDRINSNWIAMKSLCNKRHCFVGSVTQGSAATYDGSLQSKSSFSEDHRKYAHTNGTLGLTQNSTDKKFGVSKMNWLVLREGEFNEKDVCFILQCLRRGQFCVDSYFPPLHGSNCDNVSDNNETQEKRRNNYRKRR